MMSETSLQHLEGHAEKLLQKFFDGDLTLAESEELLEYWDRSPKFDTFARKNLEIEQHLRFFCDLEKTPITYRRDDVSESVVLASPGTPFRHPMTLDPLDLDDLVRLEAESHAVPQAEPESEVPSTKTVAEKPKTDYYFRKDPSANRLGFIALALCVMLAALAIYYEFHPVTREPQAKKSFVPMARVAAVVDPVFPENAPTYKVGQLLEQGGIRLLSGMMEILLENEVRIVLEGPATFDLRTPMKSFCREGRLSVEVPKGASGFEIHTPLMNVRDIGTQFVVDASDEQCAVHVIKGEVAIDRFSGGWTPLTEGLGMIAKPGNVLLQILADATLFVTELRIREEANRYEAQRLEAWRARKARLDGNPDVLLHLDFMQDHAGVVKKSCRFVSGRWSSQSAAAFSGKTEVVHLSLPQRRKSFTLIASVWLYSLAKYGNTIFSIGETSKGSLAWQLTHSGEIQLLLGDQDQSVLSNYSSPALLSRRDVGVWIYVASVVDAEARTVTHYIDGKPVASHPWIGEASFDFTEAQLGNWLRNDRSPTARNFNGKIDEFILLGRAAPAEEIRLWSQ